MDKSQVIIVDEKDEIIGYKDRESVVKEDIYRVTGLWVENSQGKILLVQRAFSMRNSPGKWGPAVAGTVEKGETYDNNIVKEAEEEIGLKDCSLQKGEKRRITGEHNFFVQWYFTKLDRLVEDFQVDKREVEDLKWFSREEVERMMKETPEKVVEGLKKIPRL
jgi:isopentenyldiphosphate isomerase